jgi:hypothetical protein
MRVDFFRVESPEGTAFSEQLLAARPDGSARVQKLNDRVVRLQEIHYRGNRFWDCEMIRIRMDEVPIVASLAGELNPVDLEDNEGIGEETCFIYDTQTEVMAIQRNRFGVSPSLVARFFEQANNLPGPIVPTIILEADAIGRLSRMRDIRRFNVRFAGVTNPRLLMEHQPSPAEAIQIIGDFQVPSVEVQVSMGRSRGIFRVADVLRRVGAFVNRNDVDKLRVHGTFDDDTKGEIDIFQYAMKEEEEVIPDAHRNLPYSSRIAAVRSAFHRRETQLRTMFPN